MHSVIIRDVLPSDFDAICCLNDAEVQHTSPMDSTQLTVLHGFASYHKAACVDGLLAGFLLAIPSGAPYPNANFEWFTRNYSQFLYIDRIVVTAQSRELRIASRLYEDIFAFARSQLIPVITCEYNIFPPNEPSRRFHDKFGFTEQGTQWLANGSKQVSLQAAQT